MKTTDKAPESKPQECTGYAIKAKVPTFNGELFRVHFTNGVASTYEKSYAIECFYAGCEVTDLPTGKRWERGKEN